MCLALLKELIGNVLDLKTLNKEGVTMWGIYTYRKTIAKITLVSVLVFLFIAISYKIFRVKYSEGSYPEGILRSTLSIDNSMPEKSLTSLCNQGINSVSRQLPDLFTGFAEAIVKLSVTLLIIYIARVSDYKKADNTLVSLCVRMDE